jgi:two-component system, OmpR family, KDP operon response regulator KdpE
MHKEGRLLVVDDERSIRYALSTTLGTLGFDVEEAETGEEELMMTRRSHYDAVLLDINMPGMGGVSACKEIRHISPGVPILMLTIRDAQDDKVEAFECGADDYITKPFHMRELTARVRAAVRRSHTFKKQGTEVMRIGEIELNSERRQVRKRQAPVHLTPKEFDLLQYLMANAGKPITHAQLLRAVWGPQFRGELEYLRSFMYQLRRKLEDDPASPKYLLTDSYFGYRFDDQVTLNTQAR